MKKLYLSMICDSCIVDLENYLDFNCNNPIQIHNPRYSSNLRLHDISDDKSTLSIPEIEQYIRFHNHASGVTKTLVLAYNLILTIEVEDCVQIEMLKNLIDNENFDYKKLFVVNKEILPFQVKDKLRFLFDHAPYYIRMELYKCLMKTMKENTCYSRQTIDPKSEYIIFDQNYYDSFVELAKLDENALCNDKFKKALYDSYMFYLKRTFLKNITSEYRECCEKRRQDIENCVNHLIDKVYEEHKAK